MGGGTYINFRRGTTGGSSVHMAYISRESAVGDRDGVISQNIPEGITNARDYKELRTNLRSYADVREDSEIASHKSKGEPRTHFRTTISFEKTVNNEQIKEMTKEWLKENFEKGKAVGFIHRDTEHPHVHIWMDARQIDGRKIDLKPSAYKSLDEKWNKIYSRKMGKEEKEHLRKKVETQRYKQGNIKEKPVRLNTVNKNTYLNRETKNYRYGAEKEGLRRDQRKLTNRNKKFERAIRADNKGEPRIEGGSGEPNSREQRISRNNSVEERKLRQDDARERSLKGGEREPSIRVKEFRAIKSRLDSATNKDRELTAREDELYSRVNKVYKRVGTKIRPNRGENREKEREEGIKREGNLIDRSFKR